MKRYLIMALSILLIMVSTTSAFAAGNRTSFYNVYVDTDDYYVLATNQVYTTKPMKIYMPAYVESSFNCSAYNAYSGNGSYVTLIPGNIIYVSIPYLLYPGISVSGTASDNFQNGAMVEGWIETDY